MERAEKDANECNEPREMFPGLVGFCHRAIAGNRLLLPEDSGGVPDAVVAFANIVAVTGLLGFDGGPVAVGLTPAGDAVDARIHQVLIWPAFSDYFHRQARLTAAE